MNILFVCTGNTCRSCMAEAIFNSIKDSDKYIAKSAGIYVVHNSISSNNACKVLKDNLNIDIYNREAVQINNYSISEADLILTMTYDIKDLLIKNIPEISEKTFCITEYLGEEGEIPDPFGKNIEVYNNTYNYIKKNILLILKKLKEDKHYL